MELDAAMELDKKSYQLLVVYLEFELKVIFYAFPPTTFKIHFCEIFAIGMQEHLRYSSFCLKVKQEYLGNFRNFRN